MKRSGSKKSKFAGRHLRRGQKQRYSAEFNDTAETLSVRRDMVTLLTYVRDNKVVGTQSTGNMPLKAVREVTARFVKPPQLDTRIGERTYRLRSETDVWPLYFLHILGEVGDLLAVAPARRWRLTREGEKFLTASPLPQVSFLLTVWWTKVNWLVAYPFEGMGEALPPFFNIQTLNHLRSCPVGKAVPFERFADDLIEQTGLVWKTPDSRFARWSLHSSIEQMVIRILMVFGAVTCKYREEPVGKGSISKLDTFEITPFGKALLDSVAIVIS